MRLMTHEAEVVHFSPFADPAARAEERVRRARLEGAPQAPAGRLETLGRVQQ